MHSLSELESFYVSGLPAAHISRLSGERVR